ncbi:MAG: NHL repeat-containing protein, partial [Acidobacteriota bacterium]
MNARRRPASPIESDRRGMIPAVRGGEWPLIGVRQPRRATIQCTQLLRWFGLLQFRGLLAGLLLVCTCIGAGSELRAQTAHFSGMVRTLGSGDPLNPVGVAVDRTGDVFIADATDNAVKEMVAVNGSIPTSPTVLTVGSGFNHPEGVAVDGNGNVFVADQFNNAVKEIVAGTGGAAVGKVNSASTVKSLGSGFNHPEGVAIDGSGNVFVADLGNNAVKEMLAVGGSIPASPTIKAVGSGFSQPTAVAVDGSGNVFVADTLNNVVKQIVAGTGGAAAGTVNSSSTVKILGNGFSEPDGVAVDSSGNVFVAD